MQLIRVWSSQKHAHIQFNILNKQTLREAQKNPEKYRDLVVGIAVRVLRGPDAGAAE